MHLSYLVASCDCEWDAREESGTIRFHIPLARNVDEGVRPDKKHLKLILRGPQGGVQQVSVTSVTRRRAVLNQSVATFAPVAEKLHIDELTFIAPFREQLAIMAQRDGSRLEVLGPARGRKLPDRLVCQIRRAREIFHF